MWRDDLYDVVVDIGWNRAPSPRPRQRHLPPPARPGFAPTAGCVAVEAAGPAAARADRAEDRDRDRPPARAARRLATTDGTARARRPDAARSGPDPKIALPMRTWVAPSWIAAAIIRAHAHREEVQPLRRAIVARSAKCGDGGSRLRRDAHEALDLQAVALAAGGDEGVGVVRHHAALLRLLAGIHLHEKARWPRRSWRSPSRAPRRARAGRGCG